MKAALFFSFLMSLAGAVAAGAQGGVDAAEPRSEARAIPACGRELICLCHDMWFLLSSVSDKKQADVAAPSFRTMIDRTIVLAEEMYKNNDAAEVELELVQEQLAESLDELSDEFDSLCKIRCFGSDKLIAEFRYSMEVGMFADDYLSLLDEPEPHLTESEARVEMGRFKHLVEPDRELLNALSAVQDARTAGDVSARLRVIAEQLNALVPAQAVQQRDFAPSASKRARKAYAPIEPLLWGIRTEIVRIASLPGYHKKEFDLFSDALENVFRSLADTHYHFFDEVFDASFHSDLDEALRENVTTSK